VNIKACLSKCRFAETKRLLAYASEKRAFLMKSDYLRSLDTYLDIPTRRRDCTKSYGLGKDASAHNTKSHSFLKINGLL